MIPSRWEECLSVHSRLVENKISVTPKVLLEDFGFTTSKVLSGYTQDQLDWISSNQERAVQSLKFVSKDGSVLKYISPAELLATKISNFVGWKCYTPSKFIGIDADGSVYDSSCKQRKKLGSIYEGFTFVGEPVMCETQVCWCYSDLNVKKERV